jgi:hypothetical protein
VANRVVIPLVVDDQGTVTLGKVTDKLEDLGKKAKAAQGTFGEFGKSLASGLGIGAGFSVGAKAAEALLGTIRSVPAEFMRIVEAGGKLTDVAASLNTTTGFLQEMKYNGDVVGVSLEKVTSSAMRMQRALVDTPDRFQAIGIAAQGIIDMEPGAAFREVAETIGAIPNPTERAAAAMRIFGKTGAELLPLISNMHAAREEAELLGTTVADDQLVRLDSMSDAVVRASSSWDALKTRLVATTVEMTGLDTTIDGLAVSIGALNHGADEAGDGFDEAADKVLAFTQRINPLTGALALLNDHLKRQAGELYAVAAAAKAADAAYSAKIFKADLKLPGPQGTPALELLNEQLRESASETAKATREHERLTEAAKKEQEAFEKLGKSIEAAMTVRPDVAGIFGRSTFADLSGSGGNLPIERLAIGDKDKFSSLVPGGKEMIDLTAGIKRETIEWDNALQRVSNQFAQLGSVGGPLGGILNMLAQAGNLTASVGSGLKDISAGKKAGGFGGAMSQAAGVIGIASAAIGFIGGLFGAAKRKREEAKRQQAELLKESESQLKSLSEEWDKVRRGFIDRGSTGVEAMFKNIANGADASAERMARLSRMGAAAFNLLRKEGLSTVEAMEQLGPTIEAAIEAAKKSGKPLSGPLKMLADFKNKVDKNRDTVNAVDGLNDYISMLRATGSITEDAIGDVTGELADLQKQLEKAGFTPSQQLKLMAPLLYQLAQAEKESGIQVDETTQKLIDQAEAAGLFNGMTDPMQTLVEIQQQMLVVTAALAQAFGATLPASVQQYIDKLNQIPTVPAPPGTNGVGPMPQPSGGPKAPEFAEGGVMAHTGWAKLHGTPSRPEFVLTSDQMSKVLQGRGGGVTGYAGGGGRSAPIHVDARGASNPREVEASARRGVRVALERGTDTGINRAVRRAVGGRRAA